MAGQMSTSSKRAFKLHCSGCHICKKASFYGQSKRCFGCCACLKSATCPGCCKCSVSFLPRSKLPDGGLPFERATEDTWTQCGEGIWTRIWPPPKLDVFMSNHYGIGTKTMDMYFACSSQDTLVRNVCGDIAIQLSGHRDDHGCDCDWLYLDHRKEGSGQQWRWRYDDYGITCLSIVRPETNKRKRCQRFPQTGFYVRQFMRKHDDLCDCGCFGTPEDETMVTKTTTTARLAISKVEQRTHYKRFVSPADHRHIDRVEYPFTSRPRHTHDESISTTARNYCPPDPALRSATTNPHHTHSKTFSVAGNYRRPDPIPRSADSKPHLIAPTPIEDGEDDWYFPP